MEPEEFQNGINFYKRLLRELEKIEQQDAVGQINYLQAKLCADMVQRGVGDAATQERGHPKFPYCLRQATL